MRDKPIVLELFSGMGKIAATVRKRGGIAYTVDWSESLEADLHADVGKLTVYDIYNLCGGIPDVVWASPQCTTYSIACSMHRKLATGLVPMTELAAFDDEVNVAMWQLIDKLLLLGTEYYFVENPQGRMRHMPFVQDRPRYTITYCSYGNKGDIPAYSEYFIRKATDIWTNYPNPPFKPTCMKPYQHEHINMKFGKKRNYLSRGEMPQLLIDDLVTMMLPPNDDKLRKTEMTTDQFELEQYQEMYRKFMADISTDKEAYELRFALKEANSAIETNVKLNNGKLSPESRELIAVVESLYKSRLL